MMWRQSRPRDEALLVALAKRFRELTSSVETRADFRSSLRTFLMMEGSVALVPDPSRPSAQPAQVTRLRPRRGMVIATGFVATALGLGGVTSASATALPGDALYPVKRATEQVELTFHRDLPDRGAFQLELAERRLDEARELSARGPESSELATESLRDFEEAAAAGGADLVAAYNEDHDRTSLVVLNRFTNRTDGVLNDLAAQLPDGGTEALTDARDRLEAMDSHSEQLCPGCGGGADESSSPPSSSDGPDASDGSDGSTDVPPAPESEPEAPPSEPEPSEQAPVTPPAVSIPSDESDDQDESDNEDQSDDSDDESPTDEPLPTLTPTPTPIPTPTVTPVPTPTPTPTPEPEPTEPPGGLLGIVPELLDVLL